MLSDFSIYTIKSHAKSYTIDQKLVFPGEKMLTYPFLTQFNGQFQTRQELGSGCSSHRNLYFYSDFNTSVTHVFPSIGGVVENNLQFFRAPDLIEHVDRELLTLLGEFLEDMF